MKRINYFEAIFDFLIEITFGISLILTITGDKTVGQLIYMWILGVFFTIFIGFRLISLFGGFKLKIFTKNDSFLIGTCCSLLFLSVMNTCNVFNIPTHTDLGIILIIPFLFVCLLFCIRYRLTRTKIFKESECFNLTRLYKGENDARKSDIVLDLPSNENIFAYNNADDQFVKTINNYHDNKRLIVHVNGKWGSGKTSFWLRAKDKFSDDIIVIDDFDFWTYQDEDKLFRGLYTAIAKATKMRIPDYKLEKYINLMLSIIFSTKVPFIDKIPALFGVQKPKDLTYYINNYLIKSNKRIVILIDDIDRGTKENINFLFRVLCNYIDFKNIIYVLVYDEDEINHILGTNSEHNFMGKIINIEYNIPPINNDLDAAVSGKCILNQFNYLKNKYYKNSDADLSNFLESVKNVGYFENPRQLISFLNKMPNLLDYYQISLLNIDQLFACHLFMTINKSLFNDILNIDHILDYQPETNYFNKINEYNESIKNRVIDYIKKYNIGNKYNDLLAILFPNILNNLATNIIVDNSLNKNNYSFGNKNFIKNYLFLNSSICIEARKYSSNLIKQVNDKQFDDALTKLFTLDDRDLAIRYFIDDLSKVTHANLGYLFAFIIDNADTIRQKTNINNITLLFYLAEISAYCLNVNEDLYKDFVEKGITHIELTNFYYQIAYRIKNYSEEKSTNIINKINCLIANFTSKDSYNWSSTNNYYFRNTIYFARDNDFKKCISNNLNKDNILYLLNDYLQLYYSSLKGHGYNIDFKGLNLYIDNDKIDDLIKQIDNASSEGEILMKIYEKSKEDSYFGYDCKEYYQFSKLYE